MPRGTICSELGGGRRLPLPLSGRDCAAPSTVIQLHALRDPGKPALTER